MIGWLRGIVRAKHPPVLLLDVGGVGYELEAPMSTFAALPATGEDVSLFTHLVVREDAHQLFGFSGERERDMFRALLKVNGVGAKVALAILSGMDGDSFTRCVVDGDVGSLTRLPGIGKKTAERLIMEMRDRLDSLPAGTGATSIPGSPPPRRQDPAGEAVSALIALGLKPQEASRRIAALTDTDDAAPEELVRQALRSMAS